MNTEELSQKKKWDDYIKVHGYVKSFNEAWYSPETETSNAKAWLRIYFQQLCIEDRLKIVGILFPNVDLLEDIADKKDIDMYMAYGKLSYEHRMDVDELRSRMYDHIKAYETMIEFLEKRIYVLESRLDVIANQG